jgi:hypothetical protein
MREGEVRWREGWIDDQPLSVSWSRMEKTIDTLTNLSTAGRHLQLTLRGSINAYMHASSYTMHPWHQ